MSADKQLKAYIDRVLRLKEEQDTLGQDIRDIYAEAKADGYDKTVMGKLVAHLRKVQKEGDGAVSEAENVFDTYLQAYRRASGMPLATHAHEEDFDPVTGEILDREARRRQLMSEDMADHKNLIDELANAGMISEEAREENKRLADAVATKFGNGPTKALQSPRKAAEAVSERTATNSEMDRDGLTGNADEAVPAEKGRKAIPASPEGVDLNHAGAGESPATEIATASQGEAVALSVERVSPKNETSSAGANVGGDHVELHKSAATDQAGAIVSHVPATLLLRPHCQRPDMCGSGTRDHCWSCRKAMQEAAA